MQGFYDNINFNYDISKLKSYMECKDLILHIWDNTNRTDSPELIHKEIKNKTLKDWRKDKNYKKDIELLKTNKNIKLRFLVSTFNLPYTKENESAIFEWANELMKYFETKFNIIHVELHLNESRPHIHVIILNTDSKREIIGNFNKYDKNIKLSGKYYVDKTTNKKINLIPNRIKKLKEKDKNFFKKNKMEDYGKDNLDLIWKEGGQINKKIADKYGLKFKQEPTNEYGIKRKIKRDEFKKLSIEEFRCKSREIDNNYLFFRNIINNLRKENENLKNKFCEWVNIFKNKFNWKIDCVEICIKCNAYLNNKITLEYIKENWWKDNIYNNILCNNCMEKQKENKNVSKNEM